MARLVIFVIYGILLTWSLAILVGATTLVIFIFEEMRDVWRETRMRRAAARARAAVIYRNMSLQAEREINRYNKEQEAADSAQIDPRFEDHVRTFIHGS